MPIHRTPSIHLHRRRCCGGCRRRRRRCLARHGGSWHRRCRGRLGLDGSRRLRLDVRSGRNEAWRQRALPFDVTRRTARVARRRRSSRYLGLDGVWRLDAPRRHTLAWQLRRRRCSGATLRWWRCHAGRRDGAGSTGSASCLLSSSVPCQSDAVLLALHRLHFVRPRAREIDHAVAKLARCVIVRACSLLGRGKPAQILYCTPDTAACSKYSGSSRICIKTHALVI